jgi:hypothetical protein
MRPKKYFLAPVWPASSGGRLAVLPPPAEGKRHSLATVRQSMVEACAVGRALIACLQANLERQSETEERADVREDQRHG